MHPKTSHNRRKSLVEKYLDSWFLMPTILHIPNSRHLGRQKTDVPDRHSKPLDPKFQSARSCMRRHHGDGQPRGKAGSNSNQVPLVVPLSPKWHGGREDGLDASPHRQHWSGQTVTTCLHVATYLFDNERLHVREGEFCG